MPEKGRRSACMGDDSSAQIRQHLAASTTEELREELADLILDKSDAEYIVDLIDAYMEELDRRSPCETAISAEESLQAFQEKYPMLFEETPPRKRRRGRFPKLGAIMVAVVLVIALLAVPISGTSGWEAIAHWSSEIFSFTNTGTSSETNDAFQELREVLAEYGITDPALPQYLPEGYVQTDILIATDGSVFSAIYQDDNDTIHISITKLDATLETRTQKDDGDPELYSVNGTEYYVMANSGLYTATWTIGEYSYELLNVNSKELLYQILDSIE